MGKKPTPWSLFFILQISVHIACCQSPLKAMRPHLLRVQHHLAPKHKPAPQPFPQPALLSFQEAVASPDHSSSSPRVGRGSCPEKAPGFAVAQGQQAQTCLHRDSHIRPSARMPPAKAESRLHEPCRASSLCPQSTGTDASSSAAPPWQLWPPQEGE